MKTKNCAGNATAAQVNKAATAYKKATIASEVKKVKSKAAKASAKRDATKTADAAIRKIKGRTCAVPGASSSKRKTSSKRKSTASRSSSKSAPKTTLKLKNSKGTKSTFKLEGTGISTKKKIMNDGFRVVSRTRGGKTYYYKGPKIKAITIARTGQRLSGLKR